MIPRDRMLLLSLFVAVGASASSLEEEYSTTAAFEPRCPPGMTLLLWPSVEWCLGFAFYPDRVRKETIETAAELCASSFNGSGLPSINTWEENAAIRYKRTVQVFNKDEGLLGLQCGKDGQWYWQNGEPWAGYSNFEKGASAVPERCDYKANAVYYMNRDGRWERHHLKWQRKVRSVMCTIRPIGFDATAVPALPPIPLPCEPGWTFILGVCYLTDASKHNLTWNEASGACAEMGATLPIVPTTLNDFRLLEETFGSFNFKAGAQFWLGLVCENTEEPVWIDGTPYDYEHMNFLNDSDANCTYPDYGFYMSFGEFIWFSAPKEATVAFLVCSKHASLLSSTSSTTSSASSTISTTTLATIATASNTRARDDDGTPAGVVVTTTLPTAEPSTGTATTPASTTTTAPTTTSASDIAVPIGAMKLVVLVALLAI